VFGGRGEGADFIGVDGGFGGVMEEVEVVARRLFPLTTARPVLSLRASPRVGAGIEDGVKPRPSNASLLFVIVSFVLRVPSGGGASFEIPSFRELEDAPIPDVPIAPLTFVPSNSLHSFSPKLSPKAATPGVGASSVVVFDTWHSTLHALSKGGANIFGFQALAVTPPDL